MHIRINMSRAKVEGIEFVYTCFVLELLEISVMNKNVKQIYARHYLKKTQFHE